MVALLRAAHAEGIEPNYVAQLLSALGTTLVTSAARPAVETVLTEPLTAREIEVLHLLASGASNQGVADALIISVKTRKAS